MAIASVHEIPDEGIHEEVPGLEKAGKRGKWYLWYLWYALAWAPFAAAYYAVFVIVARAPFISASTNALRNVVPAALLGMAVVAASARIRWPLRAAFTWRLGFFTAHTLLATLFSVLWSASVTFDATIATSMRAGAIHFIWMGRPALQWQLFAGFMLYGAIAGIAYAAQISAQLRDEEARRAHAEARSAREEARRIEAELHSLRAQLKPHFIFNTLASISSLVRQQSPHAVDAVDQFASLLRHVLHIEGEARDEVRLNDEWHFTSRYLALEQLRLETRLHIVADLDPETLDCLVPAFSLQPIVENAVRHGIAPTIRGGTITIRSRFEGESLVIDISDDGAGASPRVITYGSGLGLGIIRQRIATKYGDAAALTTEVGRTHGFRATLRIPIIGIAMSRSQR